MHEFCFTEPDIECPISLLPNGLVQTIPNDGKYYFQKISNIQWGLDYPIAKFSNVSNHPLQLKSCELGWIAYNSLDAKNWIDGEIIDVFFQIQSRFWKNYTWMSTTYTRFIFGDFNGILIGL